MARTLTAALLHWPIADGRRLVAIVRRGQASGEFDASVPAHWLLMTAHRRRVFTAIVVDEIPLDALAAEQDAAERYPGVAVHLAACGPCGEDFAGLLVAVTGD
jgi:hypothetical protein